MIHGTLKNNMQGGSTEMKTLVAYMSQTGNTQKVAEAIFDEIQGEKEIAKMEELDGLDGYDFYFVGFPIQAYGPAQAAKVFLEKSASGKDMALFITHASGEDAELVGDWLAACKDAAVGANVVGLFNCRGELSENVAQFMKDSGDPNLIAWADERPDTMGQPDAARLERARAFAREIVKGNTT
jgi:flavodoxin